MLIKNVILTDLTDKIFQVIRIDSYISAIEKLNEKILFGEMSKDPIEIENINYNGITHQIINPRLHPSIDKNYIIADIRICNDDLKNIFTQLVYEKDFKLDLNFRAYLKEKNKNSNSLVSIDSIITWDIQRIRFRKELYKYFNLIINNYG